MTTKPEHQPSLRQIRTEVLGYTQERMAQALQTSLRSYCRWEKHGPSRTAMALATRLAADINQPDISPAPVP